MARFQAAGFGFEIRKEEGGISVHGHSKWEPITYSTPMRIHEALQFVLGRVLRWSVLEIQAGGGTLTRVSAVPDNRHKTRVGPPIAYRGIDKDGFIWTLFDRYLTYALPYREELYHPVFGLFHSIIESGAASLEAEMLASSVGIEALLKEAFGYFGQPTETLSHEIKAVRKGICGMSITPSMKQRVLGSLSSMLSLSPKDQLYAMKNAGLIEERLIKAWGKLRNKAAHGTIIDPTEIENYVRLCDSNIVLFYQLLFLAIGYSGVYTDYSTVGYRDRIFRGWPLPAVVRQPSACETYRDSQRNAM